MKKIILAAGLAVAAAGIQAQPPQGGQKPPSTEEKIKHTSEVLQKEVQPDAKQKAAIESAFKTFFAAAEKVRKENPPPPPDPKVKAAMEKLEKERDEAVQKILTVDQYKKYKKAVEKLKPPMPGENDRQGPPPMQ